MSVLSVTEYRTFGPGAAVVDLPEEVLQFWIDSAEETASGIVGKRGYEALIATAGKDFKGAIIKIATWDIMVLVRGVSPMDPAHDSLKQAHKHACDWFESVAAGQKNLASPATRTTTGLAQVFSSDDADDDGRGW